MAQIKTFSWTNPATAVARNLNCGFEVAKVEIYDQSNMGSTANPGVFKKGVWTSGMAAASAFIVKNTNSAATDQSSYITSNGVTALDMQAQFGAVVSGFTNAAPGVVTVSDGTLFQAGDEIRIEGMIQTGAGASKNGNWTVASVSGASVTLVESTASGYQSYSSGGTATVAKRLDQDGNLQPYVTVNTAVQGVTLGTAVVGADSSDMIAVCYGQMPVV